MKPLYKLHIDGSRSLVYCGREHYKELLARQQSFLTRSNLPLGLPSLIKTAMNRCGLKQKDLAELLGVSLDRVKSLTTGKVRKLTPDEIRRLVQSLDISLNWLLTGEGEIFDRQGDERASEMLPTATLGRGKTMQESCVSTSFSGDELAAAKARITDTGQAITEWARERDLDYGMVTHTLMGRSKGLRGEAHRVAVALGLRTEPDKQLAGDRRGVSA